MAVKSVSALEPRLRAAFVRQHQIASPAAEAGEPQLGSFCGFDAAEAVAAWRPAALRLTQAGASTPVEGLPTQFEAARPTAVPLAQC